MHPTHADTIGVNGRSVARDGEVVDHDACLPANTCHRKRARARHRATAFRQGVRHGDERFAGWVMQERGGHVMVRMAAASMALLLTAPHLMTVAGAARECPRRQRHCAGWGLATQGQALDLVDNWSACG